MELRNLYQWDKVNKNSQTNGTRSISSLSNTLLRIKPFLNRWVKSGSAPPPPKNRPLVLIIRGQIPTANPLCWMTTLWLKNVKKSFSRCYINFYYNYIKTDFTRYNPILRHFLNKNQGVPLGFLWNLWIFGNKHEGTKLFFSSRNAIK